MTHIHKLTGQQLEIKKQIGNVVVCYVEQFNIIGTSLFSDVIICLSENVMKNESKQLTIF